MKKTKRNIELFIKRVADKETFDSLSKQFGISKDRAAQITYSMLYKFIEYYKKPELYKKKVRTDNDITRILTKLLQNAILEFKKQIEELK